MPSDADKIRAFDLLDVAELESIGHALIAARDMGQSMSYYVLGAWGERLLSCLEQAVAAKEARDA